MTEVIDTFLYVGWDVLSYFIAELQVGMYLYFKSIASDHLSSWKVGG